MSIRGRSFTLALLLGALPALAQTPPAPEPDQSPAAVTPPAAASPPIFDPVWARMLTDTASTGLASTDGVAPRAPAPEPRAPLPTGPAPMFGPDTTPGRAGFGFALELGLALQGSAGTHRFEGPQAGQLSGLGAFRGVMSWSSFIELFGDLHVGGSELSPSAWAQRVEPAARPTSGSGTHLGASLGLRATVLRLDGLELYAQGGAVFAQENYRFRRETADGRGFASLDQNGGGPFGGAGARLNLGGGWSVFTELNYTVLRFSNDVQADESGTLVIADAIVAPLSPGPESNILRGFIGLSYRFDLSTPPDEPRPYTYRYVVGTAWGPGWPYYPWVRPYPYYAPYVGPRGNPGRGGLRPPGGSHSGGSHSGGSNSGGSSSGGSRSSGSRSIRIK